MVNVLNLQITLGIVHLVDELARICFVIGVGARDELARICFVIGVCARDELARICFVAGVGEAHRGLPLPGIRCQFKEGWAQWPTPCILKICYKYI